jgi:UDP-hydrolysing UDP-N-acetyl-D-glucosamine 2-epimerase
MRKIAVILVDRANYGRLKPVMQAIKSHPELSLQVVCAGTMVLDRFDSPIRIVERDGFLVESQIYLELEGSTPNTMAKSVGLGIMEFANEFARLKPSVALVIGDRFEALAAALAASYMNVCLAHAQGGEVSGSVDESARHCITKLAHFHFPATTRAAEYVVRMGESPSTVFMVGCPSGDIALSLDEEFRSDMFKSGLGARVDPARPYVLVVFHPVTTQFDHEGEAVEEILHACAELDKPVIWLWPNIDAGSDKVSRMIRRFRETKKPEWLRLIKNFPPDDYLRVLRRAECAIGNSSSFVRDASFFGTPVVLVGDRQDGRECAEHVLRVGGGQQQILDAIRTQIGRGRYAPSFLYGDGRSSERIARHLATLTPYVQKRLSYVSADAS